MKTLLFFFASFLSLATLAAQEQFGITFDGTGGQLTLCHNDKLDIGDGFTVEAWVFSPQWRSEFWQGSIINKEGPGPDSGFGLRAGKGGIINFVLNVDGIWFETDTEPLMNVNQWYHLAATIDDKTVTIYLNGVQQVSNTFSGDIVNSVQPLTIGASPGFPGRIWNGNIDEVRVWDYARTAEEIDANQTTDFTGEEEGLVVYLPFREGTGTTTANLADSDCSVEFVDFGGSPWGDGYSIPPIDVGISAVRAPDVLSMYERPVKTTVVLNNYGSEPASNIPVQLNVNGIPTLIDTYTGTILPGEALEFTFEEPIDLTGNRTNLLAVSTTLGTDPNTINDGVTSRYRQPSEGDNGSLTTSIFNREQHNFAAAGQARTSSVNLPADFSEYGQLLLHLSVQCPSTGCDPWDQTGNISVLTPQGEVEIMRFVTPFGIACGGDEWIVDVTDFKDILSGSVTFKSFIQVFGPSGWLLNVDLEMIPGEDRIFQKTTPLWSTQYLVYGDPNKNGDLDPLTATLEAQTTESHFRMTISGHGQGNTDNAAEFSDRTHMFMINGEAAGAHRLWKDDCLQNTCANQLGTWRFNRAGWCPGQAVQPWIFDMSDDFAGQEIMLDYELENYRNFLNSGYNNMGHTEPFHRIAAYIVEESETPYTSYTNLRADSIVIEVAGDMANPTGDEVVLFATNTGTETITGGKVAIYSAGNLVAEEDFTSPIEAGATMEYRFSAESGLTDYEDVQLIARLTPDGDENESDDATNITSAIFLVSTSDVIDAGVQLYPNPANGFITMELTPDFIGGQVEVVDVTGRVIQTILLQSARQGITLEQSGLNVLRFRATDGRTFYHKVVNR